MRGSVAKTCDANLRLIYGICIGPLCPPAPVFPVPYGNEGLEVGSLQTVLQQLLGGVDVLRDALHTFVQHPRALADLALKRLGGGEYGLGSNDGELGGRGVKMCYKLAKMMREIESGDCAASLLTHTCQHLQEYRGVNGESDTALCLCHSSFPLVFAAISHLLPDNPVLRRC